MAYRFYGRKPVDSGWLNLEWVTVSNSYDKDFINGNENIPFHPNHPLTFHVLTKLPVGEVGNNIFKEYWTKDIDLLPINKRGQREKLDFGKKAKSSVRVFDVDIAAGDGEYVFTTPIRPVSTGDHPDLDLRPAVAFMVSDLDTLASGNNKKIGIRDEDMYHYYTRVTGGAFKGQFHKMEKDELKLLAKCGTSFPNTKNIMMIKHAVMLSSMLSYQDNEETPYAYIKYPMDEYLKNQITKYSDQKACEELKRDYNIFSLPYFNGAIKEMIIPVPVPLRMAAFYRINGKWYKTPNQRQTALNGVFNRSRHRLGVPSSPQL